MLYFIVFSHKTKWDPLQKGESASRFRLANNHISLYAYRATESQKPTARVRLVSSINFNDNSV